MPRLEYSERFAEDLAGVTSPRIESMIFTCLDNIEAFGDFGSSKIPESIGLRFGDGVRKAAVDPFDVVYTWYPESDSARIEALVSQRAAW